MAIFHMEAKVITRGVGRTACGAAAYMSCSRIFNDYDGIQHDYTRKGGLVWERIFLPPMAPGAWEDREALWNAVEAAEKAKDSRLAREFIVALPVELDRQAWIGLVSGFVREQFVADGMCADAAIHDVDGHNPHAHILLTVRPLNADGIWQHKTEKEYLCVREGQELGFTSAEFKAAQAEGWEKQYPYKVGKKKVFMTPAAAEAQGLERASKQPKSTKYGRQNPISARWNSSDQLSAWRAAWADTCNRWLERAGQETRIDHRSHATRGLDEKPTIHEGVSARKLEAAGFVSERCEMNRQIRADNALVRNLKATIQRIKAALETSIPALAAAMETVRQNVIAFSYGLLHIRRRKREVTEYVTKARRGYEDYRTLHSRIRAKLDERKILQAERDRLGFLSVGKRKELKARISELSEEIEELRFQEKLAMHVFEKNDAAGMKQVWADIASAEKDAIRLGKDEVTLADAISREADTFRTLKEQANTLDLIELTDARLSLREQMEAQAKARIRKAMSSGQVSILDFRRSIQDADALLDETGMVEHWEREKRLEAQKTALETKKHRARSREGDR